MVQTTASFLAARLALLTMVPPTAPKASLAGRPFPTQAVRLDEKRRDGPSAPQVNRTAPVVVPALVSEPEDLVGAIVPVKDRPLTFRPAGLGRPSDVTLVRAADVRDNVCGEPALPSHRVAGVRVPDPAGPHGGDVQRGREIPVPDGCGNGDGVRRANRTGAIDLIERTHDD